MAGPAVFPDTVFDVSIFNDFPVGVPAAGATGGRLMASMPHTDGVIFFDPGGIKVFPVAQAAIVRIGKGDWVSRATVAAQTTNWCANICENGYRTGETYIFAVNEPSSGAKLSPAPPAKGIAPTSIFAEINIGTAAITSGTLGLSETEYVNGVARVVTDVVAPTALTAGQIAVSTNGSTLIIIPVPGNPNTQEFIGSLSAADANTLWQLELQLVQAATSTIDVIGLGIGFNFNWN
jgi:hypothetical protein